jgi:hypothetical protein
MLRNITFSLQAQIIDFPGLKKKDGLLVQAARLFQTVFIQLQLQPTW